MTQGSAAVRVERIGAQTEYGKIGLGTAAAPTQVSPLKRQTGTLVRTCAAVAGILFALVCVATWFNIAGASPADRFTQSVLAGITLAMAMIPEEFPVILTVFLSMGAWRLARERALVRSLPAWRRWARSACCALTKRAPLRRTVCRYSGHGLWTVASGSCVK